jgi:hypothetical protein
MARLSARAPGAGLLIQCFELGVGRIVVPRSVHQNIALLNRSGQIIMVVADRSIGRVDETESVWVYDFHGCRCGGQPGSQAEVRCRKSVVAEIRDCLKRRGRSYWLNCVLFSFPHDRSSGLRSHQPRNGVVSLTECADGTKPC